MKSANVVWVLGAVAAISMGMAAQACSSSTTSPGGGGGGGVGGGSSTGSSNHTGAGGSNNSSSSNGSVAASGCGGSSSSSGPECFAAPKPPFAETAAGVYCPFSETYPAKQTVCAGGQHCCEPPEKACALSTCVADGTQCPVTESTDWECAGTLDCAAQGTGLICCGQGKIDQQGPQGPTCPDAGSFPYASGFYGTACQKSCETFGSGSLPPQDGGVGFQVCSQSSECATGYHCVGIKPKGNTIGYCEVGAAPATDAGGSSSGSKATGSSGESSSGASSMSKASSG